jgi:DNA invertase Pin-like site-specific DNA recombinase
MKSKVVSYLRVSTIDQDTEKNKAAVLKFCNDKDFGKVQFVEEIVSGMKSWKDRKIFQIILDLQANDKIIVPELSRLGRSTLECLEILKTAKDKGIAVYSVKENFQLNGDDMQSKIMATMLSLFAELERTFISMRTKEALKARKANGVILGRPKGRGKSKLDAFKPEIESLLKNGSKKTFIAKRYNTTLPNLYNFLHQNQIEI